MKSSETSTCPRALQYVTGLLLLPLGTGCIELQQALYSPNPNGNTIVFFNENESEDNDNSANQNDNDGEDNENTEPNDNLEPNENGPAQNTNDNTDEGIPPLPDGVVLVPTSSGLQIAEIVTGTGEFASLEATIVVNYTGWLQDTEEIFDSAEGASFLLGSLIEGWQEGVLTMQEGGKRRLIIPPDLAYGAAGRPPTIPGNATLVFDIELLEVL